ncbi:hypothetical protein B9T12_04855 [Wohlfahrtiimonas chitiniclastica]|uniref:hypothetical protein n=1 Tax=Wohlfahrtiimonas chitiniclastica TaxID=400946 RepID=UPI000B98307A|nr:hypothetical protein [Wohlfahrtiimonas chitiniclastica]OYQ79108.1 hypothetical protein B9T12_04855 [Wohlfahrtiimonas chitiniclastica]
MTSEVDKIEFYFKVLARYDQYIILANGKAQSQITLLGTFSIAVTALLGWGLNKELSCMNACLILSFVLYIWTSYKWYEKCMQVIAPNIKSSKDTKVDKQLSSIFYGDVDKFKNVETFISTARLRTYTQNLDDLLNQVHVMANITNQKFNDYKKTSIWMQSSFVLLLVILILAASNTLTELKGYCHDLFP